MKKRDKVQELKKIIDDLEVSEYTLETEKVIYPFGTEYTLTIKGIHKSKEDVVIIDGQRYSIKKIKE